ncbi:hypothetical protein AHAS_Ahas13G0330700 [Arachis hypogaea]
MRLRPQFFRLLSVTDIHMIIQIVGSAPGFPHGIIDPIEVRTWSVHQALVFVSM